MAVSVELSRPGRYVATSDDRVMDLKDNAFRRIDFPDL
jgi:hypothetical protein